MTKTLPDLLIGEPFCAPPGYCASVEHTNDHGLAFLRAYHRANYQRSPLIDTFDDEDFEGLLINLSAVELEQLKQEAARAGVSIGESCATEGEAR
jgi:hypothetical protein